MQKLYMYDKPLDSPPSRLSAKPGRTLRRTSPHSRHSCSAWPSRRYSLSGQSQYQSQSHPAGPATHCLQSVAVSVTSRRTSHPLPAVRRSNSHILSTRPGTPVRRTYAYGATSQAPAAHPVFHHQAPGPARPALAVTFAHPKYWLVRMANTLY